MRILATFITLCAVALSASAVNDHIILRNGQEHRVKLYQINDRKVVYALDDNQRSERFEVPSTQVYMVYIKDQGNVYFNPDGQRFSGELERVNPSKNDVIYLVAGREIAAENIRITAEDIRYDVRSKGRGMLGMGKGSITENDIPKDSVFMIRYRNGITDIITPIDSIIPAEPEAPAPVQMETKIVVVTHEVERGDTLAKVAEKYGVTSDQIKEWNDLPARQRNETPLRPGTTLTIYQQITQPVQ